MKTSRKFLLGASCVLSALAVAQPAVAQGDADEEIIVTATKRAVAIQDVPFSVNAQTQQDIQRAGAGTLEELSRSIAGLSIQNLGPGQARFRCEACRRDKSCATSLA